MFAVVKIVTAQYFIKLTLAVAGILTGSLATAQSSCSDFSLAEEAICKADEIDTLWANCIDHADIADQNGTLQSSIEEAMLSCAQTAEKESRDLFTSFVSRSFEEIQGLDGLEVSSLAAATAYVQRVPAAANMFFDYTINVCDLESVEAAGTPLENLLIVECIGGKTLNEIKSYAARYQRLMAQEP